MKSHPWFEDMDWDRLESRGSRTCQTGTVWEFERGRLSPSLLSLRRMECQVPYKPAVRSRKDLSNFVAKKEDAPKTLELLGRALRSPPASLLLSSEGTSIQAPAGTRISRPHTEALEADTDVDTEGRVPGCRGREFVLRMVCDS